MAERKQGWFGEWAKSIAQGVVTFLVCALIPGALLVYLEHIGSVWTKPLLIGMAGAFLMSGSVLAVRIIRQVPPKRETTTLANVEAHVRTWLDNFRVTVQNQPYPGLHFRVLATMDSGTKMLVGRSSEEFTDYVFIRSDVAPSADDVKFVAQLSDAEKNMIVLEMRLALSRFKVGCSGITVNMDPFNVFKRVPINDRLDEDAFISAMDEVEAAMHTIANVYLMTLQKETQKALEQTLHDLLTVPPTETHGS